MGYLLPAQYEAYGLGADTPDELVTVASALMEAYCRRPTLFAATFVERVRLRAGTQTARLSFGPLADGAITAVRVRYAAARRSDGAEPGLGGFSDNLNNGVGFAIATAFGLPGTWSALDPTTVDVYLAAREITLPANVLGLGFNEAELTYTAGFTVVPAGVLAACAQVVRNAQAQPSLSVQTSRLDTMSMSYFGATLIDDDVRRLLKPYVAERLS